MLLAIEAGEAERARSLMFEHLVQGESTLLKTTVPA
jgi:DNA-binding GntR family transcriptional regulator